MTIRPLCLLAFLAAAPAAYAQPSVSFGLRLGGNLATRSSDNPAYSPDLGFSSGTNQSVTTTQQAYTRTALLAPQVGAVLDVRFGKVALQPAVLFSQKGVDQTLKAATFIVPSPFSNNVPYTLTEEYHLISRPNYFEIPFNVVYTTGGDHGFQVFAGPYAAFGLGGQTKLEVNSNSTTASGGGGANYLYGYRYGTSFFTYRDDYPGIQGSGLTKYSPDFVAHSGALVARRFDAGVNVGIGYRLGPLQVQVGYGWGLINQQPGRAPGHNADLTPYYQRVGQLTATYLFGAKPGQ